MQARCRIHVRLERVSIQNIRSFERVEFPLGSYTVVVGPNNSGKTNLLRILDTVSKNENMEYLKLNRTDKFDPNESSEITLSLVLDESEAKMVFQCLFGLRSPVDAISKKITSLDITIFWDKDQLEIIHPKFTLYQFGGRFTIAANHDRNILFNMEGMFATRKDYENEVDCWRAANRKDMFDSIIGRHRTSEYAGIGDKESFIDAILDGHFDSTRCNVAYSLPMSIEYDPNAATPIIRLIKGRKYQDEFSSVSMGTVLNRIFEDNFTLIREIHPSAEGLSKRMASLRNSRHARYIDLCDTFREITNGVEVRVESGESEEEQVMFIENGSKYDIDASASGYYALASIMCNLYEKTSGLVAIDEPENHLHPEMSSRLHAMLGEMARSKGIQNLIVTHSTRFVTYRQTACINGSKMIVVTRPDRASQVHANLEESVPPVKPHMFHPEIFFVRGSMIVEGSTDYQVMRAISDHYGQLFEKNNMALIHCGGKGEISAQADLHRRFGIPYHCMADGDYEENMEHLTKLDVDVEAELKAMGMEDVRSHEDYRIYHKVTEFLKNSKSEKWKKSGIWRAFKRAVKEAGGAVPPQPRADAWP